MLFNSLCLELNSASFGVKIFISNMNNKKAMGIVSLIL